MLDKLEVVEQNAKRKMQNAKFRNCVAIIDETNLVNVGRGLTIYNIPTTSNLLNHFVTLADNPHTMVLSVDNIF